MNSDDAALLKDLNGKEDDDEPVPLIHPLNEYIPTETNIKE